MVEAETAYQISSMSIRLSGLFAVVGIALMYIYIGVTDASAPVKVLWASALSLAVAITFLVIWTLAKDALREKERESKKKQSL
jgi:hypothetical protein